VKRRHLFICGVVSIWILGGTGCSISTLKEQNRRLKESNDRLISENNRLEEELAALQKKRTSPELVTEVASLKANDPGKDGARADIDKDLLLIDDEVEVRKTPTGVTFRVPDRIFFSLGQATLSVRGQGILEKVARIINNDYPNRLVRVEGHTDDTPIRKVRHLYPTNWELSTARACTVVRFLVERGSVNAHRIYPAGFSYYRPTTSSGSASAKSKNRRVEITVLNETT
jgi:chemotaxis protein MotB